MATGRVPTTANSPLTAKGDLFTYSTAPARLAVGNNGEQIVADSSTSTGLRYQGSLAAGKNACINGGMDIWQRGTSIALSASASNYTADRWVGYSTNTSTVSRQVTNDTTNLPFIQYCARVQRTSGQTATAVQYLVSSFESTNSIPYAGKTISFSFYARAGANYSSASSALSIFLAQGTGTDQSIITGFTGETRPIQQTPTLTTTWQRFTYTTTLPATSTQLGVGFFYTPVGTAGAADFFEVTGVQVEVGAVATQFSRAGATIQGELAACQRYYFRNTGQQYTPYAIGMSTTATDATLYVQYPVPMRAVPSSVEFANLAISDLFAYSLAVTTLAFDAGSVGTNLARINVGNATGATTFRPAFLRNNNNTAGYLGMSAEL